MYVQLSPSLHVAPLCDGSSMHHMHAASPAVATLANTAAVQDACQACTARHQHLRGPRRCIASHLMPSLLQLPVCVSEQLPNDQLPWHGPCLHARIRRALHLPATSPTSTVAATCLRSYRQTAALQRSPGSTAHAVHAPEPALPACRARRLQLHGTCWLELSQQRRQHRDLQPHSCSMRTDVQQQLCLRHVYVWQGSGLLLAQDRLVSHWRNAYISRSPVRLIPQ